MPFSGIEFHKVSTDEWIGINERDPADEDGLRLLGGPKGTLTIMYVDIPGNSWNPQRLAQFAAKATDELTIKINRASLPADHPYIQGGDPQKTWLYWEGDNVVEKLIVIENPIYSQEAGLSFDVRRIKRRD